MEKKIGKVEKPVEQLADTMKVFLSKTSRSNVCQVKKSPFHNYFCGDYQKECSMN